MSTEIVDPDDRTALVVDADGYGLALTTCWPLWAGAFATQRYVIHAVQFSPVPEEVTSGKEPFLIIGAIAGG